MPIRVDVAVLQSIARQVRSGSRQLQSEGSRVNSNVQGMLWVGNAYQRFTKGYRDTNLKLSRTIEQMDAFADQLERIAEAFRQADLEEDRRREQEERARREREAMARSSSNQRR
ncbi:WXG100 family type VII secretion target [Paenibacillus sp.]|jgi:WXG100 family type VII secretion target|uniref:WXG100 family type VII secretion target n=1 Tax=Paenibacillus sp. TaxID=58172 RepID=UPI0028288740|nr:WXG100 family type VII secretion target [Paenibacillus sp.]MDR0268496.1 WXG100 family type VII secretion target [Paenibacillus sp.]